MFINLFTGIIASMAHVITGPDHLAAVTPLAIDSKKHSWKIGIAWGIGHTTGMLLIGMLFIALRNILPVEKISSHSEFLVGIMLIAIGTWAILKVKGISFTRYHVHPHVHKDPYFTIHIHGHSHKDLAKHQHQHDRTYRQNTFTALAVGIIHGLAGFSHLLAVLPTLALPGKMAAVFYLSGFGCGTIFTMVGFASVLGWIADRYTEQNKKRFLTAFSVSGGILAILVGILWITRVF